MYIFNMLNRFTPPYNLEIWLKISEFGKSLSLGKIDNLCNKYANMLLRYFSLIIGLKELFCSAISSYDNNFINFALCDYNECKYSNNGNNSLYYDFGLSYYGQRY